MELRPGPYFWKISQGKSPLTIPLGRTPIIIHGCQGVDRRIPTMELAMGEIIRLARE